MTILKVHAFQHIIYIFIYQTVKLFNVVDIAETSMSIIILTVIYDSCDNGDILTPQCTQGM